MQRRSNCFRLCKYPYQQPHNYNIRIFTPKKKWKILESRELRETRRRRGRRRQWRWRYRWRRRCRGTPLRGRGPTCPDMLLCSTFRSDPICSQMWFWFLNLSMLFCWFLLFFFLWRAFGARSLSLAHSGSLDSYATQCVRMCDWIWWTFGPLLWAFFLQRDPLYVLGLSLLKRERNEMEMCTKETKSRFQLNFTRSCC